MRATATRESASALAGYAAAGVFWGAFAAATPAFQRISGLGTGEFGLLLLALTSGALPTMLLFGRVADRVERWAMPGCLAAFAVAAAVVGLAGGPSGLAAGLFLAGAASGALDIALNMRVSRIERSHGVRLFNRAHAVFPLALLATSPAVGLAREAGVGVAPIFACVAAALLASAAIEAPLAARRAPVATAVEGGRAARRRRYDLTPAILALGFVAACGAFMEMASQAWAAVFVEQGLGATAAAGGAAPAAFTLGMSAGRFLAHEVEVRVRPLRIVAGAALAGIPAFALVAVSGNWPLALAALFVAGAAVGPIEPTVFRAVTERSAEGARGATLSLVTTVAYLGYLLSPPVLGGVAEGAGWPAMWLVAAALAAAVAGLAPLAARLR